MFGRVAPNVIPAAAGAAGFATTKLETYAEFAAAAVEMAEIVRAVNLAGMEGANRFSRKALRAVVAYMRSARNLRAAEERFVSALYRLILIAPRQVEQTARQLSRLRTEERVLAGDTTEFDMRLAAFVLLAQADLGRRPSGRLGRFFADRIDRKNEAIIGEAAAAEAAAES
jgi:hypothetical protein